MTAPTETIAPDDIPAIHNVLATGFTDRYIKKMHLSAIAYGASYDPSSALSDYGKTWWQAAPNRASNKASVGVLAAIFKMHPADMQRTLYAPFLKKGDAIAAALKEYSLMTVTGHDPDLQAAIPSFGISRALAGMQDGNYRKNLHDMFRISHAVATRGLLPLKLGRRELPFKSDTPTLLRAARLIMNPHFTFPRTRTMTESGIPEEFFTDYNAKARSDCLEAVSIPTDHPAGFQQSWVMAPGAGPDLKGQDAPEGLQITKKVGKATIKLVGQMGCGILPVRTRFGHGQAETVLELGTIIPPNEVTPDTLPNTMADLAAYRRAHGESNVYYAEELSV